MNHKTPNHRLALREEVRRPKEVRMDDRESPGQMEQRFSRFGISGFSRHAFPTNLPCGASELNDIERIRPYRKAEKNRSNENDKT